MSRQLQQSRTKLDGYGIFSIVWIILLGVACHPSTSHKSTVVESSKLTSYFEPDVITLREVPDAPLKELVEEELVFVDSTGVKWFAPQGTYTDGASVPRAALWISNGRFNREVLKAAIVHDAYCQSDNATRCEEQYQSRSWEDVHQMFYEALLAGGTSSLTARIMYAAVYLAGPRWDDPLRDLSPVSDLDLGEEFEKCKAWIEATDPPRSKIEAWMIKHETMLLQQSD